MKSWINKRNMAFTVVLLGLAVFAWFDYQRNTQSVPMATALLVPDDVPLDGYYVQMWLDAAQEDGVELTAVHSNRWVQSVTRNEKTWEGAILPDTFHRNLMPGLSIALHQFVRQGGKLMVVYDAGTLDEAGRYPLGKVGLTKLVGVDYAMYNKLRDTTSQMGAIKGSSVAFEDIGMPPGRYVSSAITPLSDEHIFDTDRTAASVQVGGYGGLQRFSSMVTEGEPNGEVILRNDLGHVVASRNRVGQGETLFVNLPLTYLKQRTDGIFLHGFLRLFSKKMLLQPQLSEAPRGRGAVVLNWHVDAKPALPAMRKLTEIGLFKSEGPFSFHVTAGPDVNTEGDGGGLDIDNSPEMQSMLKDLQTKGHAISSHGGWIHNYFGANASESNVQEMRPLLEKNFDSMERLTGQKALEYSAPQGNQPLWVHEWLQNKGVIATYLTGNIGMGPTRLWMGNKRISDLWTFPVLTWGSIATAEDAFFNKVPENAFDNWLQEVTRYVQEMRTVRLIYFHPPGAVLYPEAITNLVARMAACRKADQCQWLTMTRAAQFMSQREETKWSFDPANGGWTLNAQNDKDLKDLAWRIPKQRFAKPIVAQGDAAVETYANEWLVVARAGKTLKVDLKEVK
jgi:hypothetical protein